MQHSDLGAKHKSLLFPRHLVRAWAWAFAATSNEAWIFLFWFVIFGENLASEVISGLSSILFLLEEGFKKKKSTRSCRHQQVWPGLFQASGRLAQPDRATPSGVLNHPSLFFSPKRARSASQDSQEPTARRAHG